jgi:integrase
VAEPSAGDRSPKTVAHAVQVLGLIMEMAVAAGAIRGNPCRGIRIARSGRQEMHFLIPDQIEMVADAVANPPIRTGGGEHRRATFPGYGFLVRFAVWTGLRAGELGALRRGRVDFLRGHIHVAESVTEVHGKLVYGPTKTFETRSVPLAPALREELTQFMGRRGHMDDFVFHAPDGGPLRHQSFYGRHFKPAVIRAGLPGVRFHDLRHTYGALLIAQGAHPRAIMERMGHSSITVTLNIYGHLLPKIDEALTQGLDEMYRAARDAPRAASGGPSGEILQFRPRQRK